MKTSLLAVACAAALLPLNACGGSEGPVPNIIGVWAASDGSADKVINDDGRCSGMYYHDARVLDIGGVTTCTLGDVADSDGQYKMVVSQPPNERSYRVEFPDARTMVLTDVGVTLSRQ